MRAVVLLACLSLARLSMAETMSDMPQELTTCQGTVPGTYSAWNTTACPTASSTCCKTGFSVSGMGCCSFGANATCCPNGFGCCPAGTTCDLQHGSGYNAVYACKPADKLKKAKEQQRGHHGGSGDGDAVVLNRAVCKPGPHLPWDHRKRVLWIGDSLSIGMTPVLAKHLADVALVQHAPWDVRDGGAEEAAYGDDCLEFFLASPGMKPFAADVILFNWGMHDGPMGNATVPGQNGNATHYAAHLQSIVARLVAHAQVGKKEENENEKIEGTKAKTATKLVFVSTTPFVCSQVANGCVTTLNNIARDIIRPFPIHYLDANAAITSACAPLPNPTCMGKAKCFCPHCPGDGYEFAVEKAIVPAVRDILKGLQEE